MELERKSKEEEEKVKRLQTEIFTLQRDVERSRSSIIGQTHDDKCVDTSKSGRKCSEGNCGSIFIQVV